MKNFLAIYLGDAGAAKMKAWQALDENERQARAGKGIKAWHAWMNENAASLVVSGGPLGKTKRVDESGVADTKNAMTGFVVVQAENHEEAARLFENHPHFTLLPGQCVEIMECTPVPPAP